MHKSMEDLTGQKFGRLTATDEWEHKNQRIAWWCICDCGNHTLVIAKDLKRGATKSCGCLQDESRRKATSKQNHFELYEDYAVGYTFKGEVFYIDIADLDIIKQYCWHVGGRGYLVAYSKEGRKNRKQITMHGLIMQYDKSEKVVDHISGSKLDNRRNNLRVCTPQQNSFNAKINNNNTSGYTGVHFCNTKKKWKASIKVNYKTISLGYHTKIEDAVNARKNAEVKYFGEYARKVI